MQRRKLVIPQLTPGHKALCSSLQQDTMVLSSRIVNALYAAMMLETLIGRVEDNHQRSVDRKRSNYDIPRKYKKNEKAKAKDGRGIHSGAWWKEFKKSSERLEFSSEAV